MQQSTLGHDKCYLWKSLNKNRLPTNQEKQTVPKENIKVPKVHRYNSLKKHGKFLTSDYLASS